MVKWDAERYGLIKEEIITKSKLLFVNQAPEGDRRQVDRIKFLSECQHQAGNYYAVRLRDKSGKTQLSTNMIHVVAKECLSGDVERIRI